MPPHPFGWLSLLPPVIAIALAMITHRIIVSLLIGVSAGALILAHGQIVAAVPAVLETHLWANLTEAGHLRVFGFTLLMGAMIGVIHRSGGMYGVVDCLAPLARNRRSAQLVTWLLGLIVFFDDYANSLLLGGTMQPLADRLRVSREKLAYLVDSTAAPVAGLALVSTWIAGELGFIRAGFDGLALEGHTIDAFGLFLASIPYRFYVLWALILVPLVAILGRDFGPMLAAERLACGRMANVDANCGEAPHTGPAAATRRWHNAVVPIGVALAVTLALLYATGLRAADDANDPGVTHSWLSVIGQGDSYLSLLYGSLSGVLAAVVWIGPQRLMSWRELREAAVGGARQMNTALAILWLSWTLSGMTGADHLRTGDYVCGLLQGHITAPWMPTIVFVLASLVSFATGTSWGTMGILMPLVIRVTFEMVASGDPAVDCQHPLLIATIGSVLAGAIFGDHCSPISDTTILSSQASGCDHLAHVRTQMPYALLVAAVTIVCGTIPVGFGISVWWLLPIGTAILVGCLSLLGQRPDAV